MHLPTMNLKILRRCDDVRGGGEGLEGGDGESPEDRRVAGRGMASRAPAEASSVAQAPVAMEHCIARVAAPAAVISLVLLMLAAASTARAGEVSSASGGDDGAAFRRVHLRCGADHMAVAVEATPGFEGVVYTRGSFHERRPPCFLSARRARQQALQGRLTLRFPLDACHTKKEADTYSNVVVVQADEELVMPGDAAFALHCDFSRPRDVTVGADLSASSHRGGAVASRISLVEADPAAEMMGRRRRSVPTAANASDEVEMLVADALAQAAEAASEDFEDYDEDHGLPAVPRKDEL